MEVFLRDLRPLTSIHEEVLEELIISKYLWQRGLFHLTKSLCLLMLKFLTIKLCFSNYRSYHLMVSLLVMSSSSPPVTGHRFISTAFAQNQALRFLKVEHTHNFITESLFKGFLH